MKIGILIQSALFCCVLLTNSTALVAAELDANDLNSMRDASKAYASAWLSNDAENVMATLVGEPILSPSGLDYREGQKAARDFWFPADSPATTVTRFDTEELEIDGSGDLGFVRGTFTLAFDYDGVSYENRGKYVSILRKQADGEWLITHQLWDDFPRDD